MRQVAFDLETTGFKYDEGHRIVEIGAVELLNAAPTGKTFHTYLSPERHMPEDAFKVHGLSSEFLMGKPLFADKAPELLEFLGDAQLIAHNGIGFDLPFLNAELERAGLPPVDNPILDTLLTVRRKFPGAPANLDAVCQRFRISTETRKRDGHGALLDAELLAKVYVEMIGGKQRGFGLADIEADVPRPERQPARQRPKPLPSLITKPEEAAHAAFVAEMGEDCMWLKAGLQDTK